MIILWSVSYWTCFLHFILFTTPFFSKLTSIDLDPWYSLCSPFMSHSWVPLTIIPSNTGVQFLAQCPFNIICFSYVNPSTLKTSSISNMVQIQLFTLDTNIYTFQWHFKCSTADTIIIVLTLNASELLLLLFSSSLMASFIQSEVWLTLDSSLLPTPHHNIFQSQFIENYCSCFHQREILKWKIWPCHSTV